MMRPLPAACLILTLMAPVPVLANGLVLPAPARQMRDVISPLDSYSLPVGPFDSGAVESRTLEGRVERQSWRIDGVVDTTLQILAPLRDQIRTSGFDIVFECRDTACGGFDFRFATEVISAPDMHVNVRDYRFLSAMREDDEALSLLVSRMGNTVYVQLIHVAPPDENRLIIAPQDQMPVAPETIRQNGLAAELLAQGYVVLDDLEFETGAADLGAGPFASLRQLAEFLLANPNIRIALVGHTDSVGTLEANISLSRRRAGAVRQRLIGEFAIAPDRIEAEGMGYLAPRASNLTARGREANRRVEAILLSQRGG